MDASARRPGEPSPRRGRLDLLRLAADASAGAAALMTVALAGASAMLLMAYAWVVPGFGLGDASLVALLAIYAASMLSSIAGFAFSAICGALLFHLLAAPPVAIVEIMVVCSIAIQLVSVLALHRAVDWRALPPFLIGGVFSIPLGVFLLLHVHQRSYAPVMGMALTLYGLFMLLRRPVTLRRGGRWADGAAGFLGGITGGFAGFPGALVTIWCGFKGWDKTRQRGVYQPFILVMQILTLGAIHLMHDTGAVGLDSPGFLYAPAALLGTWCGLAIFRRLSNRQFAVVVNLLLIVSGLGLAL